MHIALVAMSGVRAYNPELTALGLSLPGFVERGKTIASLPSLGLLTLAALTDERHDISYHEVDDIADLDPLPDCDLVALSTYSAQAMDAYALADRFAEAGIRTVIGGLHVTAMPDEALEHCDAVVVGEGESVWEQVVADAEAGPSPGCIGPTAPTTSPTPPSPATTCSTPTATTDSPSRPSGAARGDASSAHRR